MSKKKLVAKLIGGAIIGSVIAAHLSKKKAERTTYKAEIVEPIEIR